MSERLAIIGSGRHAAVVADCVRAEGRYAFAGFVDDFAEPGATVDGTPVLGPIAALADHDISHAVAASGHGFIRMQMVERTTKSAPEVRWANVVHPTAHVAPTATLGRGVVLLSGSIVGHQAEVGDHVLVNTKASVDHDNVFADYSGAGVGATTGGNVTVGRGSYLAIGASVRHGVTIGVHTVIGGQAYVHEDCEANCVYFGVPARKVRAREEDDSYL